MPEPIRGSRSLAAPLAGSVVTLGVFDGVHLGHQRLIQRTVDEARARAVVAVGYTFHPHPARVLAPRFAPPMLMGIEERAAQMHARGLDHVVVEPFDSSFSQVTADEFVRDFLVVPLAPRHVVVGFNFNYGRGRAGDPTHLETSGAAYGFSVEVVPEVRAEGIVCSSTRIREFLLEGNLLGASALLGRAPALTGPVVKGDQRGRTLGFATANVEPEGELLPRAGVYASRVRIDGEEGPSRPSVTNIGRRPTFGGGEVAVETHLLDFVGDLYGRRLEVELVARIRDERRFEGLEALKAQLTRDVEAARAALG